MAEYVDLLKRPEWFARRAEVIEAAGNECQGCGIHGAAFQVHHLYYLRGRKPWEYPDDALQCLCASCHTQAGLLNEELQFLIGHLDNHEKLFAFLKREIAEKVGGRALHEMLDELRADRRCYLQTSRRK